MAKHLAEATTRTALIEKALEAIESRRMVEDIPALVTAPVKYPTGPVATMNPTNNIGAFS
jgi:hypothetical protein